MYQRVWIVVSEVWIVVSSVATSYLPEQVSDRHRHVLQRRPELLHEGLVGVVVADLLQHVDEHHHLLRHLAAQIHEHAYMHKRRQSKDKDKRGEWVSTRG